MVDEELAGVKRVESDMKSDLHSLSISEVAHFWHWHHLHLERVGDGLNSLHFPS